VYGAFGALELVDTGPVEQGVPVGSSGLWVWQVYGAGP